MRHFSFFAMAIALLTTSIIGHTADRSGSSCKEIVTSQQVFECSTYEKVRADKTLNNQYRSLLERVDTQYKLGHVLGIKYSQKIKESQRIWIKLRDADCALETYEIEAGTQAYESTLNNCIARISDERSRYLERIAPNM